MGWIAEARYKEGYAIKNTVSDETYKLQGIASGSISTIAAHVDKNESMKHRRNRHGSYAIKDCDFSLAFHARESID